MRRLLCSLAPAAALSDNLVPDPDVEIYVVNADGTEEVNISTNDTFEHLGPQAWGP